MAIPVIGGAIGILIRFLAGAVVRFFIFWMVFKWARVALVIAAKVALFWMCYKFVTDWVWFLVTPLMHWIGWAIPKFTDEIWDKTFQIIKATESFIPWEFIGTCLWGILTVHLWLLTIKIVVRIFELCQRFVEFVVGPVSG